MVCDACMADLSRGFNRVDEVCPRCSAWSVGGVICGVCQKEQPAFDDFWASSRYEMPLPGVLHAWKHLGVSAYVAVFSEIMFANLPPWLDDYADASLLAMPLSRQRRLFRGFNQSEELAAILAKRLNLSLMPLDTVFRQHREPQSTLGAKERKQNVRKVFSVSRDLSDCKIVLIDDVVTTGATVAELAESLKKAGASRVGVWSATGNKMQKI